MKKFLPILLVLLACQQEKVPQSSAHQPANTSNMALFKTLDPAHTGITFNNTIVESEKYNYIQYDVVFNGGGVAAGDINNDGLIDLYFSGNQINDALYLNKGKLQFENISQSSGIAKYQNWSSSVLMADINNDGFLDIYVCKYLLDKPEDRENMLFVNNGDNTFTERGEALGVADQGYSTSANFLDYDLDGDLDLYVGNQMPASRYLKKRVTERQDFRYTDNLYRNDGDRFVKVTEQAGVKNYAAALSVTVSDINDDGRPDIYVANDYEEPDFFYINMGDGTFKDISHQALRHMSNFSMGVDIADFNNDGFMDIYSADMVAADYYRSKTNMSSMNPAKFWNLVNAGYHHQYMANCLQLNNGNGTFSDIAFMAGVANTDWSWTTLFADFDLDGYKDLYVSNGLFRDVRNKDYINGIQDRVKQHNERFAKDPSFDLNKSVFELATEAPSHRLANFMFRNTSGLDFEDVSSQWGLDFAGWTQGGAYTDLDNDGDLDLVINNMNDPSMLYQNMARENNLHNYLKVQLKAADKNLFCYGAKVKIWINDQQQLSEISPVRGFLSQSEAVAHFGLGEHTKVDKLEVIFPDGSSVVKTDVQANQQLVIHQKNAKPAAKKQPQTAVLFDDLTYEQFFPVSHNENSFDDYKREILIPYKLSTLGPCMAKGDINGDGLDDLFFGSSAGSTSAVFVQTTSGKYQPPNTTNDFAKDAKSEDIAATFFDVDNDGDQDLYVVSGGNEYPPQDAAYQDRLYINDGKGNLKKSSRFKAPNKESGGVVVAADFDLDGYQDLFVGGRQVPGKYGYNASSVILKNEKGLLKNVTEQVAPHLSDFGMVTDARWTDIDNDKDMDLFVVGEWMPLTVLVNDDGQFKKSENESLNDTEGWWYSIEQGDFDGDGDLDFIAGNMGLNIKHKASKERPFRLFVKDFDHNGTNDVYLAFTDKASGVCYPVRGKQCSSEQMPFVKKKFATYKEFATASVEDILAEKKEGAVLKQAILFESVYIENRGDGQFSVRHLPRMAQIAPVNSIVVDDWNGDGHLDAFVAGNLWDREVETTRSDAGTGLIMLNNGKGEFDCLASWQSGIYAAADVRDVKIIENAKHEKLLIIANNNALAQTYRLKQTDQ